MQWQKRSTKDKVWDRQERRVLAGSLPCSWMKKGTDKALPRL